MAAAIDGETRLDADKAIAAGLVRMRVDLETADHAPAMQLLLVVAQLFHVEARLVGEIALDHELAGEIVVPREGPVVAGRASELGMYHCVNEP